MTEFKRDAVEGEYLPSTGTDPNVTEEPIDDAELTPQNMLNYSQRIRRELVADITRGGMPADKGDRQILLNALHDADATAVNQMRHDLDKENAANGRVVQDLVDKLSQHMAYGLAAPPGQERPREVEFDDSALDGLEVSTDEMKIGVEQETAREFIDRVEGKPSE